MELKELFRYRDEDLKEKLGTNNNIGKGSLIVKKYNKQNIIHTVLARNEKFAILKDYKEALVYLKDYEKLTFDKYLDLKTAFIQKYYSPRSAKQLADLLKKSLLNYFDEDNIEITNTDNYCFIKIYYPEIIIKNELGSEHTMKELYLTYGFWIDKTTMTLDILKLYRSHYTIGEVRQDYVFSHTDIYPGGNYNGWCFGKTILNEKYNKYRNNYILYQEILPFMVAIEEYLSWESLAGVPYRYIDKIKEFKTNTNIPDITKEIEQNVYYSIINQLPEFTYKFELKNGEYEIRFTPETKQVIDNLLNNIVQEKYPDLLVYQIGDSYGNIEEYSDDDLDKAKRKVSNNDSSFIFKDNEIYANVVKSNVDIEEIRNKHSKVIHPDLSGAIYKNLEKEFYNYIFKYKNNLL